VARNLIRYGLTRGKAGARTIPYPWLYRAVSSGNRARNQALGDEFSVVIRAMNRLGLRYAIRKGPVIGEHLYGDLRTRRMNDLDVLIDRSDAQRAGELLSGLGYVQGRPSADGLSIEPFERRTQAFWRMNVNNELPFIKLGNRDEVEVFSVDLCLSLFQPRSGARAAVPELLERRIPLTLFGESSFALCLADQVIDVSTHLHKEATSLYFIEEGSDLQLSKFLDVALVSRAARKSGIVEDVIRLIEDYGAAESVYYALYHADLLYPENVPDDLLRALRPANPVFLDEYGKLDGKVGRWNRPFFERLFDSTRNREVTHPSSVPKV
jgi:hypothetical protein